MIVRTEEEEIARRLTAVIEAAGKVATVSRRSGVPAKTIYNWMSGVNADKVLALAKICDACGMTIDGLLEGREFAGTGESMPIQADVFQVPVLDVVAAAGTGYENATEQVVDHLPFPRAFLHALGVPPEKVQAIRSRGDSMFPTIPSERLVLVNTGDRDISRTNIFALRTPDGLRLKRVHRAVDGSVTLISDNKEFYPPEKLSDADAAATKVIGRAFWTERLI